jgi:hypothetical protein
MILAAAEAIMGSRMRRHTAMLMAMTILLGGCASRSISNADYPGDNWRYGATPSSYRGEINDFALLVPESSETISDQQIARTLADHRGVHARLGQPLLVVQSGAIAPDGEMLTALQRHFPVIPFNGQPPIEPDHKEAVSVNISTAAASHADTSGSTGGGSASYARRLRLAAAEGGAGHILVYWGILETAQHNQVTQLVSWVPIVGMAVPDQSQQMRIRLKAALIDTASGHWQMLLPQPISDDSWSSSMTRRAADQDQVAALKQRGYQALADQLAAAAD